MQGASRQTLFGALAFAVGWTPQNPVHAEDFDRLCSVALHEYQRRGEPAKHCQWSPDDIVSYVRWRLAQPDAPGDVGAYAYKLPQATKTGPPPLPQEVQKFVGSNASAKPLGPPSGRDCGEGGTDFEAIYAADAAYELVEADGAETLRHCPSGEELVLAKLEKGKFRICQSSENLWCLWNPQDPERPEYCCDLFIAAAKAEAEEAEMKKRQGKRYCKKDDKADPSSVATCPLKGMVTLGLVVVGFISRGFSTVPFNPNLCLRRSWVQKAGRAWGCVQGKRQGSVNTLACYPDAGQGLKSISLELNVASEHHKDILPSGFRG